MARLSGQEYAFLVALAALTNMTVASRLATVYLRTRRAKEAQLEADQVSDVVP